MSRKTVPVSTARPPTKSTDPLDDPVIGRPVPVGLGVTVGVTVGSVVGVPDGVAVGLAVGEALSQASVVLKG